MDNPAYTATDRAEGERDLASPSWMSPGAMAARTAGHGLALAQFLNRLCSMARRCEDAR
jgi:hypothetical protein